MMSSDTRCIVRQCPTRQSGNCISFSLPKDRIKQVTNIKQPNIDNHSKNNGRYYKTIPRIFTNCDFMQY